jgi:hypothetical protein
MRVFKTKPFARFAAKESIVDAVLRDAIRRAEAGLVDADLGGGVIKLRLARQGRAFFAYGFAKNDRDNIDRQELKAFRLLADQMLALDDKAIEAAMRNGTITEIVEHG